MTLRPGAVRRLSILACYDVGGMDKGELANRLARQSHRSRAVAADELDRVVHRILTSLRRGDKARLPGLGTFLPGTQPGFEFEATPEDRERQG
jgi:hypothetical protein